MSNAFSGFDDSAVAPAKHIFLITPGADPIELDGAPIQCKAIRAGADGTITLRAAGDETAVVHPVLEGELIIARITHVTAASPSMTIVGYA